MEKTNKYSHLIKIIREAEQILAGAGEKEEGLPAIERDIIAGKLRKVYEEIVYEGSSVRVKAPEGARETARAETKITPPPVIPEIKEEIPDEGILEISEEVVAEEMVSGEGPEEEVEQNSTPAEKKTKKRTEIIADRLHPQYSFKDEALARQHPRHDLSSKIQSKPLADISKAIGINDKFHFIRELFNGDSVLYEKTIKTLNESHNFNEAFSFLSRNFNWDMDDPSVLKLLDLTRRKFISLEHE